MKLKYTAIHARKRSVAAILVSALFLGPLFAVTLVMSLSNVEQSLQNRTWIIPLICFAGLLVCVYLHLTPRAYLLLKPETRSATYVDGADRRELRFDQLGPLTLKTTIPPSATRASTRHYCVETSVVPALVCNVTDRHEAVAKARALSDFLGVEVIEVSGQHPAIAIDA
jgi:hypothetical protein